MTMSIWTHALTAIGAATAAWLMHPSAEETAAAPAAAAVTPATSAGTVAASRTDTARQPLIAVSSDGQVTLRVEQQPLDWVLEQIALQSGHAGLRGRDGASADRTAAVPARASARQAGTHDDGGASDCFVAAETPRRDPAQTLAAIERGSETDRYRGLLAARDDGLIVAPTTLRAIYETDLSERVRLAAFESWLEFNADRTDTVRSALESALLLPSAALQHEARRRLDELNAAERVDPDDPQRVP